MKEGDDEIEPQLDGREYAPLLPAVFDPLRESCNVRMYPIPFAGPDNSCRCVF